MTTLLNRISSRLDRLRAPPAPVKPSSRKAAPEVAPAPTPERPDEPLTIASVTAALNALSIERERQLAIVEGAEVERDRVLDAVDGNDEEVLAIDRRVALARLALDRLARLEAEAFEQLEPLQLAERQARCASARDEYVALMETVATTMEAYERAANRLWSYRSALFTPVGVAGWDDQVPTLPHFGKAVPSAAGKPGGLIVYDAAAYRGEIKRFAHLMISGRPAAQFTFGERVARFVEGKADVDDLSPPVSTWGSGAVESEDAANHPVLVRLTRSVTLPEGEVLPLGAIIRMRASHARQLVAANRAALNDTLTDISRAPHGAAGLPFRELPLPARAAI